MTTTTATRRPRIGLIDGQHAAIELLDNNGDLVWYSDSIDGNYEWPPSADFTPLAEVPVPRMDEPDVWGTVVASTKDIGASVWGREPGDDGWWRRCYEDGSGLSDDSARWSGLIDPRPTTPTERATGMVEGRQVSAERLREAAKVLRERAQAADILSDREPWAIWPDLTEGGFVHVGNAGGVIPEGEFAVEGEHNLVAKVYTPELAHYIAAMHPGVGLALADWLDDLADHGASDLMLKERGAFVIADLILGGEGQ